MFWFTFGVAFVDARKGEIQGNLYWKPHSPDLQLSSGDILAGPDQFEALKEVQSAYYLSIFIIQVWNLFACKTIYTLPFHRNVFLYDINNLCLFYIYLNDFCLFFRNVNTWLSIVAGTFFAGLIVYTPITNGNN